MGDVNLDNYFYRCVQVVYPKIKLKDYIKTLKSNSLEFAIQQQDLLTGFPRKENQISNFSPLEYSDLQKSGFPDG